MCFSLFLYKATIFLFMKCFFPQPYDGEFTLKKKISLTFFFIFLNKTMFKNKTHIMISSSRSLPKTIKKWKEKWNWLQFSEEENMFCVACRKTVKNYERCLASMKGVTISRHLLCQTVIKVRCRCKLLTKTSISKAQNMGSNIVQLQCHYLFLKTHPFWKGLTKCKPQKQQGW